MADEKFKLPGSSYEELVKIIRAYSHTSGPSSPAQVGAVVGIHETIVSRNNGFLLGTGVIEGGRGKTLTVMGLQLARALDHELPDEISRHWRRVADQTEFLQLLLKAVRIRGGMEPASLQSHVAYTAGQANRGAVKTGSATVIEILKVAGVLDERDGKLYAVTAELEETESVADVAGVRETPAAKAVGHVTRHVGPLADLQPASEPGWLSVEIKISVECSVDEIPQLTTNLGKLLRELPQEVARSRDESADD